MEADVAALEKLGFVAVGAFQEVGMRLRCTLHCHSDRSPVLYAFVAEGSVLYIGKTTKQLRARMYFYAVPEVSQRTNNRNHGSIRAMMEKGKAVEVWALVDWEPIEYRGLALNVPAGLEDELIRQLNPPWNLSGRSR